MKKLAWVILLLCCTFMASCALGDADGFCNEIPQEVAQLDRESNPDGVYLDCILMEGLASGDRCWLLSPWNLNGYRLENGVWQCETMTAPMSRYNAPMVYFRRHVGGQAPNPQGKAGLAYADSLGFDIIRGEPGQPEASDMLQYRWEDERLTLIGWQKSQSGQFALRQGEKWAFYDSPSGKRLGEAYLPALNMAGVMEDFDRLPNDLAEAQAMEAITEKAVKDLFPGWTLAFYSENVMGHDAEANYYRLDGNRLTIRRVELSSDAGGVKTQWDTMPVPLSEELLKRMQGEPLNTLIDFSGFDNTFLTENAWDADDFPIWGKVLQNELHSRGLLLLTEHEDGNRFLVWIAQKDNGNGYTFQSSGALPRDARLDLFHSGDGALGLYWNGQSMHCGASLNANGTWQTAWVMGETDYAVAYCGVKKEVVSPEIAMISVGTFPWLDFFAMDFPSIPADFPASQLDRSGWAVVSNPDPADRLHLRVKPDRSSESLGKFYNRTPVEVLSQKGDWTQVRIGLDGRLEGWMMTKYLTFGEKMDSVECASPIKTLLEEYQYCELFADPGGKQTTGVQMYGNNCWIAGVAGDEWYIMLDEMGNTGYLPQSWMWEGNG